MTVGVILAAGRGSRLKAISSRPKVLNEIAGHPLLVHILARFKGTGVDRVLLVVRDNIELYRCFEQSFRQYSGATLEVIGLPTESYIDSPLNDLLIAGNMVGLLPQDVLIVSYCDTVTNFDIRALLDVHFGNASDMTLLLFAGDEGSYLHKYRLASDGRVGLEEQSRNRGLLANAGIFLISFGFLALSDTSKAIPFSTDDGPAMRANKRDALFGCAAIGHYFEEVGTPSFFERCQAAITNMPSLRSKLFPFSV